MLASGQSGPAQEAVENQVAAENAARATLSEPYDVTEQIGYLLRRAYHRHLAIFQEHIGDPQMTAVQFATLCALERQGQASQKDLIAATAIDQGTIRGILERLHARGCITLDKDRQDARKVLVAITPAGRALLDEMIPRARDITQRTLAELNPAEQAAAIFVLRKMF